MTRLNSSSAVIPHVLIVDDRPDELRLLVEILRGQGLRLSIAFDGAKGYDRAQATVPDLILLDVNMPRMDGFALARMLNANPVTAHIPIIFLSAASDASARLTGLREGGVDYIVKPFLAEEVLERVRIHLRLSGAIELHERERMPEGATQAVADHEVLVRAAKKYLSIRLGDSLRMGELARALGVGERRLSNAFEACLGMTVFEFIRQERMCKAKRLLTDSSLNMVTIAEVVGFSSAANFSTAFRDQVGMSPSAFRSMQHTEAPARD